MEFVSFELDGDPIVYKLAYNFNEICDAEAVCGCNLLQAQANLRTLSATQLRGLLYACLKTAHPAVLLSEAGDLVSKDFGTVTTALARALGAGEEEPADEPEPATAAAA